MLNLTGGIICGRCEKVLLTKSKRSKMEQRGKFISFLCIALIVLVVVAIFYFVASKGLATFFVDKINVFDFLFGTNWNPGQIGADGKPMVGALPMIAGSFIVTFYLRSSRHLLPSVQRSS